MILKARDRAWRSWAQQELQLLLGCQLTAEHKKLVQDEQRKFNSGDKGEQDTAYYLDVRFRETPNWIVLHDLHLVDGEDVAQIDHLLINRLMELFVLETKRFVGKTLRITDNGEFLVEEKGQRRSIASPIAQNDRHITILKRILDAHQILPKKMFPPVFHNYVLIHPDTHIERPNPKKFDTQNVYKSDLFYQEIERLKNQDAFSSFFHNFARVSSVINTETLQEIGKAILQLHRAERPDYRKRFGITPEEIRPAPAAIPTAVEIPAGEKDQSYYCFSCKQPIEKNVADFCFQRKERFGGRAYCLRHQRDFPDPKSQQRK